MMLDHDRTREKGFVSVYMALATVVFLGMAALAVDVGYMYMAKRQLQVASDAAALAGVRELAADDEAGARVKAAQIATSNKLIGEQIQIDSNSDIAIGHWDGENFATNSPYAKNAVKVELKKTDATPQGPLDLLFGPILGEDNVNVTTQAIAVLAAVDMIMVLDTSSSMIHDTVWKKCTKYVGSMCGCGTPNSSGYQPVDTMKASASLFVNDFDAAVDQLAMVEFGSTAKSPINRTLTFSYSNVKSSISAIAAPTYCNSTRYTNIGDGILKGIGELRSSRARASAVKLMVLLSDGAPTCNASGSSCGTTSAKSQGQTYARQMAASAASYGIVVHAISLGDDADRDLMQDIADATGGDEYYAHKASDLDGVFANVRRRIPVQLVH